MLGEASPLSSVDDGGGRISSRRYPVSSLFHLRSREVGRKLSLTWNGVDLKHCDFPVYLGVTADLTLRANNTSNKSERQSTKEKKRKNLHHKLENSSWGASAPILRATALALCYSACSVSERSSNAKKVYTFLNESCRSITVAKTY